jgi:hypothetical protein
MLAGLSGGIHFEDAALLLRERRAARHSDEQRTRRYRGTQIGYHLVYRTAFVRLLSSAHSH